MSFHFNDMAEEEYEDIVARVEAANEELLGHFINVLILEKGVGKRKAHQYADDLRFFGNEYLLDYGGDNLLEGLSSFPSFVGDWFIRKCMWSDEVTLGRNVEAFGLFLRIQMEWGKIKQDEVNAWDDRCQKDLELWCLRVKVYNSPEMDLEDLFDEDGQWNDGLFSSKPDEKQPVRIPGGGKLVLKLLLSAKVAKFCAIKPPELVKLTERGDWEGREHSWFSNWRCEEAFGMKGTKEKVMLVTNERTRYSVLIRIPGKDPKSLLMGVHSAIMRAFDRFNVSRPTKIDLQIQTLSGAARSLTSFQNQQMYHLGSLVERRDFEFLDDLEVPLNKLPTKIGGEYKFPDQVFPEMCEETPPFDAAAGLDRIVPFLN